LLPGRPAAHGNAAKTLHADRLLGMTKTSWKRWHFVTLGSIGVFIVFLVIVGVASNGTAPASSQSKPAEAATTTTPTTTVPTKSTPTLKPAVAPAVTPKAPTTSTAVRQEHTVRTEAVDITLAAGQCHVRTVNAAAGDFLPDPACTPGATDPVVTEATIGSTICVSGYTTSVRPPTSITSPAKTESLADYGMTASPTTEYDHLVPLELGGASSVSNLWPEPNRATAKGVNNPKDTVENALKKAVCAHTVQLVAAQNAMASDWITAESVLGLG
jgi:hypothetical protein